MAEQRPGRLELPVTGPTLALCACQLGDKLTQRRIASQGKHNEKGGKCTEFEISFFQKPRSFFIRIFLCVLNSSFLFSKTANAIQLAQCCSPYQTSDSISVTPAGLCHLPIRCVIRRRHDSRSCDHENEASGGAWGSQPWNLIGCTLTRNSHKIYAVWLFGEISFSLSPGTQVSHITTANMSHESVWNSRPKNYGKGSRQWYEPSESKI